MVASPSMHLARRPTHHSLCDKRAGRCALVSPGWWQHADRLVVSRETVDAGFDENEAELGVLVLAVALKMLADGDGLVRSLAMVEQ